MELLQVTINRLTPQCYPEADDDLAQAWREGMAEGAAHLQNETYMTPNDPHYDAMLWPNVHPYGSGSLLAEPGAGGTHTVMVPQDAAVDLLDARQVGTNGTLL